MRTTRSWTWRRRVRPLVVLSTLAVLSASIAGSATGQVNAADPAEHEIQSTGSVPTHRVTLVAKDLLLEDALARIAAQAGLTLSWNQSRVPSTGRVSVTLRNATAEEAIAVLEAHR